MHGVAMHLPCFNALIFLWVCRAAGFEARYILDFTDHVWTEIYSDKQQCWLHCDPCEAVYDKPLIYEAGWGKKLSYVFAFSKDDIQDVTWRYSSKQAEVLSRRTEINEAMLIKQVIEMRRKRQTGLSEERKKLLLNRCVKELASFFSQRSANDEEGQGRTSGSLQWRLARGETTTSTDSYVFKPTENEKKTLSIEVWYSCSTDKYIRKSDEGKVIEGWKSLVYKNMGILRKEEFDWKMAYLAREEGRKESEVTWKFDISGKKAEYWDY